MKLRSRLLGLAAVSVGLLTSAATANADGYAAPARYAPVSTWTGCYAGIQGGWAWGDSSHSNLAPAGGGAGFTTPTIASFDMQGWLIGGTAGCNLQTSGGIVIGVESDIAWTDKNGSGADSAANGFNPAFTSRTEEHWLGTTRLRLGYAAGSFLLYATAGAAFADVEASAFGPGFPTVSQEKWRIGLAYGGGVEWAVMPGWTAKFEYLHVDFENQQYFTPPPPGFVNRSGGVTLDNDIVRVGLNYRFSDRREAVPLK
jgi:outer membrane immunogenic protein